MVKSTIYFGVGIGIIIVATIILLIALSTAESQKERNNWTLGWGFAFMVGMAFFGVESYQSGKEERDAKSQLSQVEPTGF